MSTTFTDFYDANHARNISVGGAAPLGVILTEINYLKVQIDTNASTTLSVTVVGATTMTNSSAYFNAWNDPVTYTDDASTLDRMRMDAIIRYFSALGFRVQRQRVALTNFFQWVISW